MPRGPTKETAARIAAGKIGCSVEEYHAHRAAGRAWCSLCRRWDEHVRHNVCRACKRADNNGRAA